MATYSGVALEWREVGTGELPSPRMGLRAVVMDNTLYVTGGYNGEWFTSVLSWDPSTESWQPAGDLAVARHSHAAVAVPSTIIESEC